MSSTATWNDQMEWLEPDGLGGFASGTPCGIRTRRYHGLLLTAMQPPVARVMLVNGLEVMVTTPGGQTFPLSTQCYQGDVVYPEGGQYLQAFDTAPWPRWRFRLPDGTVIEQELFVPHDSPRVVICWRASQAASGPIRLAVRPLLSGRDYHALHHENPSLRFDAEQKRELVRWRPYESLPPISASSNGQYRHDPLWYRHFFYQEEWLRGFEATEDLASPGEFTWDLSQGEAVLLLSDADDNNAAAAEPVATRAARLRDSESRRRESFPTPLQRAGDAYITRRGEHGKTIVAGYPWFTDWGRDAFIAIRGLCLATGRLDDARQILLAWAPFVSQGMLPNRFPDSGEAPEYNSVGASLGYAIVVNEFMCLADRVGYALSDADRQTLRDACEQILQGYMRGTRYGIRPDDDGLLAAGAPGVQLTWMDAKIGDWVVTQRSGKPVEVQAAWLNALWLWSDDAPQRRALVDRGVASFRQRFWNEAGGYLHDVVDCDHQPGTFDSSFRPNQILAVGGLSLPLLQPAQARRVVDQVEQRLWTPIGLRSLDPADPRYVPHYRGDPVQRDSSYHQGTVWPWLLGPFVEAWVRVRGSTPEARGEARQRFVQPLMRHLHEAGLGHISEIADGDPPHMPRGCPFQAWSVGEALRLDLVVLAEPPPTKRRPQRPPGIGVRPAPGKAAPEQAPAAPAPGRARRP